TTSRIIHSGRLFESMNASISFSRLTSFLRRASELVSCSSSRRRTFSSARSIADSIVRSASAPIAAVNWSSPYSSWAFSDADAARQRLQEPDMRDRRRQLDMAHAVAPHLRQGDLDAALLADDAAIFHPLVLAAQALVILDRPEDPGAEQAVPLRLEGAVVDR